MKKILNFILLIIMLFAACQFTSCKNDDDIKSEPQKEVEYVSVDAARDSLIGLYIDTLAIETHRYFTTLAFEQNDNLKITIYNDANHDRKVEYFDILGGWKLLEDYQERKDGYTVIALELSIDMEKSLQQGNFKQEYIDSLKNTGVHLAFRDTSFVVFNPERLQGIVTSKAIKQAQQVETRSIFAPRFGIDFDTLINPILSIGRSTLDKVETMVYRVENWIDSDNVETAPKYSDWMSHIDESTPISYITIPGTHDSFTKTVSFPACQYAQTQDFELPGLWARGCRHFDIRLKYDGIQKRNLEENNFLVVHGDGLTCCYCNLTLKQAIDQIHNQLKAHPTETAIVVVKYDDENNYRYAYEDLQNYLWARYDSITATFRPNMTLKDARGKIIFISRANRINNEDSISHRYSIPSIKIPTNDSGWGDNRIDQRLYTYDRESSKDLIETMLIVQDNYDMDVLQTLQNWIEEKRAAIDNCFSLSAGCPDAWVFNHTSGYTKATISNLVVAEPTSLLGLGMSYSQNAYYTNDYFNDCVKKHEGKHIGIVPMDWLGTKAPCYGHSPRCMELPVTLINHNKTLKYNGKSIWKN